MNRKVLFWAVTVALGGFLFGFDTAVISGAEQSIQKLWGLSDGIHGLAVAIALYGTVLGAMFGGYPAERYGRKATLAGVGVLYLLSAVGSALAPGVASFMFFRFLGGLGVGASSVVAPMYISEVAPAAARGRLVALFQFNIVLGIVVAYLSNYLIGALAGGGAWRWMLGVEAFPALAFVLLVFRVPRSPRWLVLRRGAEAEARAVLAAVDPAAVEESLAAIRASATRGPRPRFWCRRYGFPIVLAFLIAFFNQVSGINAIIYYAPRIFEMTGLGQSSALLSSVGVGAVNLIFTMAGIALIDRFGRRSLMAVGTVGLIATLGLVARAFFTGTFSGVPVWIFSFIAFFALSQGTVIWVFISEIFPNSVRAYGQSFGSFTHWLFAALIANLFPVAAGRFGGGPIFAFFTAMMVVQMLYVWKLMPETRGVSLEQLADRLTSPREAEQPAVRRPSIAPALPA